jgi:hypothetical protein
VGSCLLSVVSCQLSVERLVEFIGAGTRSELSVASSTQALEHSSAPALGKSGSFTRKHTPTRQHADTPIRFPSTPGS